LYLFQSLTIVWIINTAFKLEAANFEVHDINLIILTQGLPYSYSSFIVSLSATPLNQLTVNSLIIHLLNEETCQLGSATPVKTESDAAFYAGGA
jgi:hypothetical protein